MLTKFLLVIVAFAAMAAPTGFVLHRQWTDRLRNFVVLRLVIE
jgi:hypothetical protein